jgi:hypothetical protein
MQKDIVPSGQNRFVAEKSQKEIAQKGAERNQAALRRSKTASDPPWIRSASRRSEPRRPASSYFSARNM